MTKMQLERQLSWLRSQIRTPAAAHVRLPQKKESRELELAMNVQIAILKVLERFDRSNLVDCYLRSKVLKQRVENLDNK